MSVENGDILHCVIEAVLNDGSIVQNRKRFKLESAITQPDATVLNAVKTWVETLYAFVASEIPVTTDLDDGTVDIIAWNAIDLVWEVIQNVGIYTPLDTFADVGHALPNQCAAFVIGNTSRPKSKGRIFMFPFGEGSQDHGVLSPPALGAVANFATQYITSQPIGGDNLISGIVRETTPDWLPFSTVSFDDIIGTQRRRRFGIGK